MTHSPAPASADFSAAQFGDFLEFGSIPFLSPCKQRTVEQFKCAEAIE